MSRSAKKLSWEIVNTRLVSSRMQWASFQPGLTASCCQLWTAAAECGGGAKGGRPIPGGRPMPEPALCPDRAAAPAADLLTQAMCAQSQRLRAA